MKTRLATLLLLGSGWLLGADREFDRMVKAVESHYGVRHTRIPLMGFANLAIKTTRPAGTGSFHLAVFENLDSGQGRHDAADLNRFFDSLPTGKFQPLVRTWSREGEATYIYAGSPGKTTRLLIGSFRRNEATLIEVSVDFGRLMEVIGNPGSSGWVVQK